MNFTEFHYILLEMHELKFSERLMRLFNITFFLYIMGISIEVFVQCIDRRTIAYY